MFFLGKINFKQVDTHVKQGFIQSQGGGGGQNEMVQIIGGGGGQVHIHMPSIQQTRGSGGMLHLMLSVNTFTYPCMYVCRSVIGYVGIHM